MTVKKETYTPPAILSETQVCMEGIIAASASQNLIVGTDGDGQHVDMVYDVTADASFNFEWK